MTTGALLPYYFFIVSGLIYHSCLCSGFYSSFACSPRRAFPIVTLAFDQSRAKVGMIKAQAEVKNKKNNEVRVRLR